MIDVLLDLILADGSALGLTLACEEGAAPCAVLTLRTRGGGQVLRAVLEAEEVQRLRRVLAEPFSLRKPRVVRIPLAQGTTLEVMESASYVTLSLARRDEQGCLAWVAVDLYPESARRLLAALEQAEQALAGPDAGV